MEFINKYFTYNNEYISGRIYFLRLLIAFFMCLPVLISKFFLGFVFLGIYFAAISTYKRSMSLNWSIFLIWIATIVIAPFSPLFSAFPVSVPVAVVLDATASHWEHLVYEYPEYGRHTITETNSGYSYTGQLWEGILKFFSSPILMLFLLIYLYLLFSDGDPLQSKVKETIKTID